MRDAVDILNEKIASLRAENKALHEEIDDLHARINRWNSGGNYIGTNASIKALKVENESLKAQADMLSTPHTNAWFEARYKQRGEWMKEMRKIWWDEWPDFDKWFDPETGEPL